MEVNKFPVHIPCIPQSAFMVEAHFLKATPGCDIAPLNDGIHPMQVIPGKCQRGETCDRQGSQSFVPILFFADDDAYFAASMGRINMGQRPVTDQRLVRVHCEELMLSSGKVRRIPRLDVDRRITFRFSDR